MKFKFSLSEAFRDRKFKYSGTATILVIAVVIATLIVNLLCSFIPYKIDVTSNKFYSISNKTLNVLDRLEKDIDIYFLYQAGEEDDNVMELASRYVMASNHISTRVVDPIANPGFAEQYKIDSDKASMTPSSGSVIVECKEVDKFAVLQEADLYSYNYDDEGNLTSAYFDAEQAFTSAIAAVTNEKTYNIALLTGHNEDLMPEAMLEVLNNMFFNVFDLDLKSEKQIPPETDVLVVLAPEWDITEDEKDIIMDYLDVTDTAGNAIFIMGKASVPTPNFDEIMAYYSLTLDDEIIYEEDSSLYAGGIKYALMLPYKSVSATQSAGVTQKLYLNKAKPIYSSELKKTTIRLEDVAVTSSTAWSSADIKSGTMDFEEGKDTPTVNGFVPAIAVTEYGNNEGTLYSRLFIVNCAEFMLSDQLRLNNYSNDEVFYSALLWCLDSSSAMITITPKYYVTATHTLSSGGVYAYAIVLGIVVPILILGGGLVVYLKRRHL